MTSTRTGRPLVGRDPALAVTSAALAEARAGLGGLLLVSGEAGIGKPALLAEQARQAAGHGVRVLRGTCWDGPGAPPYWVWVQVLRALDGDLAEARLLEREPAADAGPTRAR